MAEVNYGILASYPNAGEAFNQAFQQGLENSRQFAARAALAALANGNDPNALRTLYANDPRVGMAMEDQLYQRADRQRQADARSAAADYILGGSSTAPATSGAVPASGDSASSAMERAARADPEMFLTIQGKKTDITKTQLETATKLHDAGMALLGGVHDQASYDAAKAQARQLYASYGENFDALNLPDAYDPQTIHDLQMQGMDTSKQLSAIAQENNINSEIATRSAQLGETHRHHMADESNTRRGQNIRSSDTQRGQNMTNTRDLRGQDIAHEDRIRGQNLTSQDRQRGQNMRGHRGGGGGGGPVVVQNVAQARALPPGTLFVTPDGTVKRR